MKVGRISMLSLKNILEIKNWKPIYVRNEPNRRSRYLRSPSVNFTIEFFFLNFSSLGYHFRCTIKID